MSNTCIGQKTVEDISSGILAFWRVLDPFSYGAPEDKLASTWGPSEAVG